MNDEIEPFDGDEIELVSDGTGVAVLGKPGAVERFLESMGLSSAAVELPKLQTIYSKGASLAQKGAEISADSGRWLKLTEESKAKMDELGGLMDTTTPGVKHAMLGQRGSIKKWLQVETGPGALATNPAMLSGAAGVMAQLAMEQAMAEITDYLVRIDEKLDDVLRAQTNQVLAKMDGVSLAVQEAMSVRATVGRVSDVTWSKVQSSSATILETQGYALRQLSDLTEKLEQKSKVDELAKVAKQAEVEVDKWLTVLARCFQLHDAVAVLEIDRVLDSSPDDFDQHRIGLQTARQDRLELITRSTASLVDRMNAAAVKANAKVLFNPMQSPAIVKASNHVATDVNEFHGVLGLTSDHQGSDARKWSEAAGESWDKVLVTSAAGLDATKSLGSQTKQLGGHAKNLGGQAASLGSQATKSLGNQTKNLSSQTKDQAKAMTGKLAGKLGRKQKADDAVDESTD
jgi:hypothetical protein